MKFLIIGLGSMGKRRVRNLQHLRINQILGFDLSKSRRKEAEKKYGIKVFESFELAMQENPDVFIISTPPDKHSPYIKLAIKNKKPVFVEASVILGKLEELNKFAKKEKVFIAPSCTLRFYSAIKVIKELVVSRKYGKVTNFNYHSGQYLPDWHPWEKVRDFYVCKKETGGAREIVPFELTWIVDIFGFPKKITGFYGKTMNVGADIDDTYLVSMNFGGFFGNMIVDVVSRYATRSLILNMEKAQVLWRWDEKFIKLYNADTKKWKNFYYEKGKAAKGYDQNIAEEMYVQEMKAFISSIKGKDKFPNSLGEDIKILKLLNRLEQKNGKKDLTKKGVAFVA